MPVVPKPLPTSCRIRVETWRDVDREPEAAKRSQVMLGAVFPSSLPRSLLRTVIWDASGQHAVEDDQHRMCNRHNRSLLAATGRQLHEPSAEYGILFTSS
jgi:hypothetical protein